MALDDYPLRTPVQTCDPLFGAEVRRKRPGIDAFRTLVLEEFKGTDQGVGRQCITGNATSAHHESRAWDWGPTKGEPVAQWRQRATALLAQLLADGPEGAHELARRFGIRNIIFNREIFSAGKLYEPAPYDGPNDHTTHVHFDWAWPGALGETSGYELGGGVPAVVFPFVATGAILLAMYLSKRRSPK